MDKGPEETIEPPFKACRPAPAAYCPFVTIAVSAGITAVVPSATTACAIAGAPRTDRMAVDRQSFVIEMRIALR